MAAARSEFAAKGYDRTSIRGIARAAGVDPALVHHYFEGKPALFAESTAAKIDPRVAASSVIGGPVETLGERIVAVFLGIWDQPEGRDRFVGVLRSALTNDGMSRALREFLDRELISRVVTAYRLPDANRRTALVASQLVGFAVARYVLKLPGIADAPAETVARPIAATLQRYLTGDLDAPRDHTVYSSRDE